MRVCAVVGTLKRCAVVRFIICFVGVISCRVYRCLKFFCCGLLPVSFYHFIFWPVSLLVSYLREIYSIVRRVKLKHRGRGGCPSPILSAVRVRLFFLFGILGGFGLSLRVLLTK